MAFQIHASVSRFCIFHVHVTSFPKHPGGRGLLNKVLYGEATPWGTLTPHHLYNVYHFWQKSFMYPFCIPFASFTYMYLHVIYNFVNLCTVFLKNMNNLQNQNIFSTFHSHKYKMHLLALLALLQTKMTDFPTPSHASTKEIRTLS